MSPPSNIPRCAPIAVWYTPRKTNQTQKKNVPCGILSIWIAQQHPALLHDIYNNKQHISPELRISSSCPAPGARRRRRRRRGIHIWRIPSVYIWTTGARITLHLLRDDHIYDGDGFIRGCKLTNLYSPGTSLLLPYITYGLSICELLFVTYGETYIFRFIPVSILCAEYRCFLMQFLYTRLRGWCYS